MGCFIGRPKSGGQCTIDKIDIMEQVMSILVDDSATSIRKLSRATGVSKSTIQRLLHKNSYKTYKPVYISKLCFNDKRKRKQFCTWLLDKNDKNNNFHCKIYFSDEATFHLNGCVNKHNVFHWATQNPNIN
uniref:HTH_7 domain-containing protein n=1 Tax=Strongyloides stercoralis TaxID=6248 RepID=A0A0K0E085_STRER